jgi:hypothetical protein
MDLLEVLVSGDREAAAEAMREHVNSSMQRALERLEPYFRARKTHGKTYSRNPKKQFVIEMSAGHIGSVSLESPQA